MSGDYTLEDSVYILFTTRAFATGIPGTLSASTVAVYEDVTATPIETSIAVTESLNSIVGLNSVTIAALAASGYNAGGHYHVVIEAGSVDSVSVVGEVVGHFTIAASAAAEDLANVTDGLGAIKAETALILADTGTTLPGTLTTIEGKIDTVDNFLDTEIAELTTQGDTNETKLDTLTTNLATVDTEVDKIPKSDSTVSWNATALAAIEGEVDDALATYDAPTKAEMDTAHGLLATEAKQDINTTSIDDIPNTAEFEARTPTAAQLLYLTRHASSAVPVTFTTSGGTTTNAVLNLVDGAAASSNVDMYNGRILVFLDGTLKDVATDITDYDASKNATITQIPFAPTASHNAILV